MFKYPSVKPHSKILSVKYKSQFMEILSKQGGHILYKTNIPIVEIILQIHSKS